MLFRSLDLTAGKYYEYLSLANQIKDVVERVIMMIPQGQGAYGQTGFQQGYPQQGYGQQPQGYPQGQPAYGQQQGFQPAGAAMGAAAAGMAAGGAAAKIRCPWCNAETSTASGKCEYCQGPLN